MHDNDEIEQKLKPKQSFTNRTSKVQDELKSAESFESDSYQFLEDSVDDKLNLSSLMDASSLHSTNVSQSSESVNSSKTPFMSRFRGAKKRASLLNRLVVVGIISLLGVEATLALVEAWLLSPWLFGLYASVLSLLLIWLGSMVSSEWSKLKQLTSIEQQQKKSDELLHSMQIGGADPFINSLLSKLSDERYITNYYSLTNDEHNDAEKLLLFEQQVLMPRDEMAKKIIQRYAHESALLLALSPIAILDMAIILWRNQRMIVAIADNYGVELGYWSRVKLIRGIISNIIYAGASELAADIGTQLLSMEITGKVSTRLAQGLGAGILTARLGYQAMHLCRPIAFTNQNRPKLTQIHKLLLTQLKDKLNLTKSDKPK